MPSAASCLQMREAAGESFPRVKPWENTPQPRTGPSGRSITPASVGPVELGNVTRSAMQVVYHGAVMVRTLLSLAPYFA
ncbi:hypothetical protein MBOE_11010 [Mycolicibacterium boenickei]|uniref:Uncharacterized protein n=1 Tax=Mycolicibacterium boenickei TaxID=146017 RepID=A0ABN5Z851_9MYCO|nr:hypothetical protein MBOE_11010 [Mycolicibacterium boenickei]